METQILGAHLDTVLIVGRSVLLDCKCFEACVQQHEHSGSTF